jgi:hypothetical protein
MVTDKTLSTVFGSARAIQNREQARFNIEQEMGYNALYIMQQIMSG